MSDITDGKPKGAGKSSFELIDPEKLIDNLPFKKGSIVLDLACGKVEKRSKNRYSVWF